MKKLRLMAICLYLRAGKAAQAVGCVVILTIIYNGNGEDLEFDTIERIWLELLIKNSKSLLVFVVY